jgi:hypothetical protein
MASLTDTGKPGLKFITIAGEPSQAANNKAIRKVIRYNASRSVHIRGGSLIDNPAFSIATPVVTQERGLTTQCTGRTRFALWSRKPMKRFRRRHAAESLSNESRNRRPIQPGIAQPSPAVRSGGSSPPCGPLELDQKRREESCHGIPRNILTVELSSSNCVPFEMRLNIGTMLQHCKNTFQLQKFKLITFPSSIRPARG